MPSLKEIKGRIASVSSTLKITSAMKMVSSAKLRKAQNAMGNMVPYQRSLSGILEGLLNDEGIDLEKYTQEREVRSVAIVCFSSNTSLCGAFNSNAVRAARAAIREYLAAGVSVTLYAAGRKISEALAHEGYPSVCDLNHLTASPAYDDAAALGHVLEEGFLSGRFDKVEFIFNHYKSAASQQILRETYLPLSSLAPQSQGPSVQDSTEKAGGANTGAGYLYEPGAAALAEALLPKVLRLKVYSVLLDTVCAEHAARVVAMQTATDNANSLLVSLTLEYNKSRQQKITSEILDIVGGSMQ